MARTFARADVWWAAGQKVFDYDAAGGGGFEDLVGRLLYHNLHVWHYEDMGRRDDEASIVTGWRGAQAHNKQRNLAINAIDALVAPAYRDGAELHSESLGSIADRLTILYLKYKSYLPRCTRTATAIRAHIDELTTCAETLQQRIERGELRCLLLPRIKLYLEQSSAHP